MKHTKYIVFLVLSNLSLTACDTGTASGALVTSAAIHDFVRLPDGQGLPAFVCSKTGDIITIDDNDSKYEDDYTLYSFYIKKESAWIEAYAYYKGSTAYHRIVIGGPSQQLPTQEAEEIIQNFYEKNGVTKAIVVQKLEEAEQELAKRRKELRLEILKKAENNQSDVTAKSILKAAGTTFNDRNNIAGEIVARDQAKKNEKTSCCC